MEHFKNTIFNRDVFWSRFETVAKCEAQLVSPRPGVTYGCLVIGTDTVWDVETSRRLGRVLYRDGARYITVLGTESAAIEQTLDEVLVTEFPDLVGKVVTAALTCSIDKAAWFAVSSMHSPEIDLPESVLLVIDFLASGEVSYRRVLDGRVELA